YRLLYAPLQLPQDTPNVSRVIVDFEVLLDEVGNSLARPQRCLITQTLGTLMEQLDQTSFVGVIQTRQPSRSAGAPKCDVPSLLVFLPPSADGLVAYLESPANLAVVETLAEQLHRLKPATFECHKIAFNAPRIAHVGLDAVRPQRFRYIMRDSVDGMLRGRQRPYRIFSNNLRTAF